MPTNKETVEAGVQSSQTLPVPKLLERIFHTIFNQSHCHHHPSICQLSSTHYCYHLFNFEGEGEKEVPKPFSVWAPCFVCQFETLGPFALSYLANSLKESCLLCRLLFHTQRFYQFFFIKLKIVSTFVFSFSILRFLKSGE